MIRFLLDTNIISELHKPKPHGAVTEWFAGLRDEQVFVSAVTLLELQEGIERARLHNPAGAAELEVWVDDVQEFTKVLPIDGACYRETARIMAGKSDDLFDDAAIAATARIHDLTIATRNEKDFNFLAGTHTFEIINPFKFKKS